MHSKAQNTHLHQFYGFTRTETDILTSSQDFITTIADAPMTNYNFNKSTTLFQVHISPYRIG